MRKGLRTGEIADAFGRSTSWVRVLERRGILPEPERDPLNGRRVYPPEAVERIREILLARRMAG
jgi:DNA-binding transcriptional MerR regulator